MKKLGILVLALVLVSTLALAGCGGGGGGGSSNVPTTTSTFTDRHGTSMTLTYPDAEDFVWSADGDDLIESTWGNILIGPDFSIEVLTRAWAMNAKNMEEQKAVREDSYEVEDEVFGGIEGFSYYNGSKSAYGIYLPIEGKDDMRAEIWVFSADESEIHDLYESAAVQRILNSIVIER